MGAFIARQPNGLLCRFSSVVDTLTDYNMTEEEYIEYCAEKAGEDAKWLLEHNVKPFNLVIKEFRPINASVEEFNAYLREMGSDIQLNPKDYE
jgi:hypothetical protein